MPLSCRLFLDKSSLNKGIFDILCANTFIFLELMSFLERLRFYKHVELIPSNPVLMPSLPKRKWFKFNVSKAQLGELSNDLRGYTPSDVILFLFTTSLVDRFNFISDRTAFSDLNNAVAPQFPILTETKDSYLSAILGNILMSRMTPSSPKGLLSRTILVTWVVIKN